MRPVRRADGLVRAGERRRRTFETIEERARSLSGRVTIGPGMNGGTAVCVVLPAYAAESEG